MIILYYLTLNSLIILDNVATNLIMELKIVGVIHGPIGLGLLQLGRPVVPKCALGVASELSVV